MLQINGKTFMNLQEAVQWLLDNNALPFQSSANYVANTEIGMGTIVNPSPAKVRIGSLIFFADSKVSTVIGLTENGFICSDQYNDLVDDVVYVSNVALNASGHLIVTLSNGDTIDAGLIKQVTGFNINAFQHLIVSYNDGSSTDLGAIFSGNITISGNLTVTGGISGNAITGNSIVENMSGYSFSDPVTTGATQNVIYAGACKNGNKLSLVIFQEITITASTQYNYVVLGEFTIPASIGAQIFPYILSGQNIVDIKDVQLLDSLTGTAESKRATLIKGSGTNLSSYMYGVNSLTLNTKYICRFECTLLLSENLAS